MNRWNCHLFLRKCENLKQLQQLHAQATLQGIHPNHQPTSCQIFNAYAALGHASDAHKLFEQIPKPDIVSFTSLISLHLQYDQPQRAISIFSLIISSGLQPDGFAVVGALSASSRLKHLTLGKSVHGLIYRHGLSSDTVVGNALIDLYSQNGRIQSAETVFAAMIVRDAVSWSSILNGFVKCNGLGSARKMFDEMPRRDPVCWTVMIIANVQDKQPVTALQLFQQMVMGGNQPTIFTIVGVLSACADVGALHFGRAIHGYACKMNGSSDITLYNALIDMYSKSGNLEMAENIFNGVPYRDVYTWTSMISGFAVHGNAKRAIEVFSSMLSSDISPNKITFLAILLACNHGGLVDEGRMMFDKMKFVYNCKPQLEHLGCMVDLLGRAGLLREARVLVQDMGMDADCVIWRSLLGASLIHGDVELAELAGKKIMELEPHDDGVYVLLWNMYASSNRWKKALEMRKKMIEMDLLKRPGCSWIELDGTIHEFLVDDKMHFRREEIYMVMLEMSKQRITDGSVLSAEEDV